MPAPSAVKPTDWKGDAVEVHSRQAGEFASRYAASERPYDSCFLYSRKRLWATLEPMLPAPPAGLRLLDVGCGTGHHLALFRERGYEVAGVDGSEEMLEHARQLNPGVELQRGDVAKLPWPDASFDVAVCVEVLRYLPDPAACLRELHRVLRPGGVAFATAAPLLSLNGYFFVNRLAAPLGAFELVRLRQYFTTSRGLRRGLLAAGFARAEVHGVYSGPVNWLERLAPSLLPGALRRFERVDAALSDRPLLRELSNMFLARAARPDAR